MIRRGNRIKSRIVFFLEGYSCQVRNWALWLLLRQMKPAPCHSCRPKIRPASFCIKKGKKNLSFFSQSSRNTPSLSVDCCHVFQKDKMREGKDRKEEMGVKWMNLSLRQENPSGSHILIVSKIKYSVSLELSETNHHNGPLTNDLHHFLWRQVTEKEEVTW